MKYFEIILLADCNFSCDYCIAGSNTFPFTPKTGPVSVDRKSRKFLSDDNGLPIYKTLNGDESSEKIKQIYNDGYAFSKTMLDFSKIIMYVRKHLPGAMVAISGGEPLLYPNIDFWLGELTKTNKVLLMTNAHDIKKYPDILRNPNIFLRVGFHPEFRDLDEFEDNMIAISSMTNKYTINYVYHPRHKNKFKGYIDFVNERGWNLEVTHFKGEYKGTEYGLNNQDDVIKPYLYEDYFNYSSTDPSNEVGQNMFYLDHTGDVNGCSRRLTVNGNIDDEFFIESSDVMTPCKDEKIGCKCESLRCRDIYSKKF